MHLDAEPYAEPSRRRLVAGLALAVMVPLLVLALLVALGSGIVSGLGFAAIGSFYAVVPAVLLGVPAYWLLRDRIAPTAWASMAAGAVVASLPWAVAALFSHVFFMVVILGAPLGAIGGFTFWFIALRGLKRSRDGAERP
jgi:hypothetical protein